MTNLAGQFDTTLDQPSVVPLRWWTFAFVVSCLLFLSTLFFLGEDAYAKPVGKSLEGAVGGGGGDHDGGGRKGDGAGGGDSSPVSEAANAIGGGAQHGGQALKDASGGVDRSVGRRAEPVSEVADPVANMIAEPVVRGARGAIEPVSDAASPLVEPIGEATRPVVEPVKEVVAPVIEPVGEIAGPLVSPVDEMATIPLAAPVDTELGTPAVDPGLFEPVVGPSLGQLVDAAAPAAVMPVDEAADIALLLSGELFGTVSSEGAVLHGELASVAQGSVESFSDASAGGLATVVAEASSAKAAEGLRDDGSLSTKFLLAALQSAVSAVEDVLPTQIPQPLGTAGVAPVAGSLSGGSGSDGGTGLGILALVLISLLAGKCLWSAREFLESSTALIPIIERPG